MKVDQKILEQTINLIPNEIKYFKKTQFPLPVSTAILGEEKIDPDKLKDLLRERAEGDIKGFMEPLLIAAELYEASRKDNADLFIDDRKVRSYVFMGSKWKAGWMLVLGDKKGKLAHRFLKEDFFVFTDEPGIEDTHYLGERDSAPIYFLQMMFRYAMVWGRIKPGNSHQMSHFLEKDMPGFIVIPEDLSPLKYYITLGLMKMGAPAVVPPTFPFPYGNRVVADTVDDIIKKALKFPNLRIKHYNRELIKLPDYANTAYVNDNIKDPEVWGGSTDSFFHLRHKKGVKKGSTIVGDLGVKDLGILVEIDDPELTLDMELPVEKEALRSINYVPGIIAQDKNGIFSIKTKKPNIDIEKISEVIYWGIRLAYPKLEKISINVIFDEKTLHEKSLEVRQEKSRRKRFISNMSEENTGKFVACIECRPFSQDHTCILTPDRIPMCASRTYFTVKAGALFGGDVVELGNTPYRRKGEKELPLKSIFDRGKVIDKEKGRYEGSDKIYSKLTRGKLKKVYLHSLKGTPHTSCGCFQNLAFWIDEVGGIGMMSRDSDAVAPNNATWDMLANMAGGKQLDGIMGVSLSYIKSDNFLRGDGGFRNIVWVDSKLHGKIKNKIIPGQKIATEKDVKTIPELKAFLEKN